VDGRGGGRVHPHSGRPGSASVLFLSAMRHFAKRARRACPLLYRTLDDPANRHSLAAELDAAITRLRPAALVLTAPATGACCRRCAAWPASTACRWTCATTRHFFSTVRDFADHAEGRKQLRLEYFYRALRQRTGC
jgi:deoxyribodipyrimidine photolyase-related protein